MTDRSVRPEQKELYWMKPRTSTSLCRPWETSSLLWLKERSVAPVTALVHGLLRSTRIVGCVFNKLRFVLAELRSWFSKANVTQLCLLATMLLTSFWQFVAVIIKTGTFFFFLVICHSTALLLLMKPGFKQHCAAFLECQTTHCLSKPIFSSLGKQPEGCCSFCLLKQPRCWVSLPADKCVSKTISEYL